MNSEIKNKEAWFFIFFLGTLLFNWPFLDIFTLSLPAYLFFTWGLFILVVGIFINKLTREKERKDV